MAPALITGGDAESISKFFGFHTGGNANTIASVINDRILDYTINSSTTPYVSVLSGGDGQMGHTVMPPEYYNPNATVTSSSTEMVPYDATGGKATDTINKIIPYRKVNEYVGKFGKATKKKTLMIKNAIVNIIKDVFYQLNPIVKNKTKTIGKSHITKLKKSLKK
jgi:hypothetical protein